MCININFRRVLWVHGFMCIKGGFSIKGPHVGSLHVNLTTGSLRVRTTDLFLSRRRASTRRAGSRWAAGRASEDSGVRCAGREAPVDPGPEKASEARGSAPRGSAGGPSRRTPRRLDPVARPLRSSGVALTGRTRDGRRAPASQN